MWQKPITGSMPMLSALINSNNIAVCYSVSYHFIMCILATYIFLGPYVIRLLVCGEQGTIFASHLQNGYCGRTLVCLIVPRTDFT